jgi:hypothetical protein
MRRRRLGCIALLLALLLSGVTYGVYYWIRPMTASSTRNISSSTNIPSSSVSGTLPTDVGTSCSQNACNSSSSAFNGYVSNNTTSTNVSSICSVILAPPPQGVYLRLSNDQGAPLPGLQVEGKGPNPDWCPPQARYNETSETTNSTGWALFQGAYISSIDLNYSGNDYNFTIYALAMSWTIATLTIPAGILSTHTCGLGGSNINSYCGAPTYTVLIRPQNGSAPFLPYYVNFWSNDSIPVISNISVAYSQDSRSATVEFLVGQPSFIFTSVSAVETSPDNSTMFALNYPNGTSIASTPIKNENTLFTNETVSGWIQIVS